MTLHDLLQRLRVMLLGLAWAGSEGLALWRARRRRAPHGAAKWRL